MLDSRVPWRLRGKKWQIWRITLTGEWRISKDPTLDIVSVCKIFLFFSLLIRVMETAPVLLEKNLLFTKNVKKD